MKPFFVALLYASLVLTLICPSSWAQATAQISGTAKDHSGAVLPGAEITAKDPRIMQFALKYFF